MLTEILIKPFIEGLEHQGIEDTTPYEQGFMAGMAALSDILSDNIDNQPQLFTYLGMAISEGMQWVESQVSESPEQPPLIKFNYIDFPAINDPRWIKPDMWFLGCECYGINFEGEFIKGKLNISIAGNFILETDRVFGNGVSKIIPLESPEEPRETQPKPSSNLDDTEWDYIPAHDDLSASLIQKYAKKDVWFSFDNIHIGLMTKGKAILDLSSNRLQVIDMNGNQIKRPYYIKLR